MRVKSILFLAILSFWSLRAVCATPPVYSDPIITFQQDNDVLYPDYKTNRPNLTQLESTVARYEDIILSGNGHIRLVSYLSPHEKNDPVAINMAVTRAAVVRTHLIHKFRMLTRWCFTFYMDIDASKANSVEASFQHGRVAIDAPDDIYYSTRRNNPEAIHTMLSRFGELPFISDRMPQQQEPVEIPESPVAAAGLPDDGETDAVAIYYRWDESTIDPHYLSNPYNLHKLDSLLTSASAPYIDTLTIVAFASPEGNTIYNERLSEHRAAAIRRHITASYPAIDAAKIVTVARGENWDGVERLVSGDPNLPSKEKVLEILRSPMNERQKQSAFLQLDGGSTYYRYILPNYYTYLRLGTMVFMSYGPQPPPEPIPDGEPAPPDTLISVTPKDTVSQPEPGVEPGVKGGSEPEPLPVQSRPESRAAKHPVALKTNLLYDLVGAPNLGVELPIGERWSVIGDAAYAYWRTGNHLYALQTLEYGLSGRYWLPVGGRRKARNAEWAKPLRGWSVGIYGRYWQRYDVQWIDGYQGDASWSAGLTAGYAFPVGRNLSLEAGIGAGYFSTSQYRAYDRPAFDDEGNYHLMWRETGTWNGITLTKVNFSLVWLIETGKGGNK